MYCGCAAPPPAWMKARYGVDLDAETAEAEAELRVAPLPPEMRGAASTRLAEAAGEAGYAFFPQPKFMSPARAPRFPAACGARCMLGCRCGAKWNAAEWVDEAVAGGAELRTRARVDRVTIEGGQATGVEGRIGGTALPGAGEDRGRRGRRHRHAAPSPGLGPARGRARA